MDNWIDAFMDLWGKRGAPRRCETPCFLLVLACLLAMCFGCHKSAAPSSTTSAPPAPAMDTIVRVHWLGKKKLSADTNSAELMAIWKMPESAKLESQTLDKLSLAPWRLLRGQ